MHVINAHFVRVYLPGIGCQPTNVMTMTEHSPRN